MNQPRRPTNPSAPAKAVPTPSKGDARALHDRLDSLAAQLRNGVIGPHTALALAMHAGWEWRDRFGTELPGKP